MLRAVLFDWGDRGTGEPMVPPCAPSFSESAAGAPLCLRRAKPASGLQRLVGAMQTDVDL